MAMFDEDQVAERFEASVAVHRDLAAIADRVAEAAEAIARALDDGHRLFAFGNGGSAADAQHIAAELSGQFYIRDRPGLPAAALTTNPSAVTAISNDYGYEQLFARQLDAFAGEGDVAIGISTSGNSANVLEAIDLADEVGMVTIGLTGKGGRLPEVVDHPLSVPSTDTPRIQEAHILIGHVICELVEAELFG